MMTGMERGIQEKPDEIIDQTRQNMPIIDAKVMDDGNHWAWFIDDLREAFKAGVQGPSWDVILYAQPWEFHLEDIQVPVYLWHGEQDTNAPVAMAYYVAGAIPDCCAHITPELGHLSVVINKAEEALAILTK